MNKQEREALRLARIRRTPVSMPEPMPERMGTTHPSTKERAMVKIERGPYQVVLACCISGNCTRCLAGWVKANRKRVVHMDRVSKDTAETVANNWRAYDPKVERMPGR